MTEPTTRQIDPRRAVRIGRGILVTSSLLFCCLFFGCAEEQEGIRAGARDLVVTKGTTESFVAGRAVPGLARPAGKSEGGEAEPNRDLLRFYDPATDRFPSGIRHRELRYVSTLADRAPDATQALAGKQQVANIDLGAWRSLGPDQNGGRTRAFGIDIEGRYMVSGCVSGGLFRMENENDSIWVKRSSPEANQSVTALAQDQREGYRQNWYYATGEVRGAAGRGPVGTNAMGSGLYRSTDSARSWEPILSTQPNGPADFDSPFEAAWRMVVDHTAEGPGTLYVACYGGIMRSDNAGETWQMVLGAEVGPRALSTDIVITSDGVLYAALSNYGYNGSGGVWNSLRSGIWRSEDGLSWHRLDAPLPDGHGYFRSVLATAPSDSTVLYLMAYAENPQTGAKADILARYRYLSGDGTGEGGEWEDRSANIPDDPLTDESWGNDYESYSGYCMSINVYPDDADILFLGGANLYRSDDGFASDTSTHRIGGYRTNPFRWAFSPIRAWYFGHHPDQHGLAFWPTNPDIGFSYTDGGPHLSTNLTSDTVNWTWYDWGYITLQFRSVAIDPVTAGDETIIGGTQDNNMIVRNTVEEGFWHLYAGDGAYGAVDLANRSVYASNITGLLWRATFDAEGNPDSAGFVLPPGAPPVFGTFPYRLDPNVSTRLYVGLDNTIWRNSNVLDLPMTANENDRSAINWQELTATTVNIPGLDDIITALAPTTRGPADRIYYGRWGGRVFRLDNAATGNRTPVEITGENFPSGFVHCVAVDPYDGDHAIVVFSNYNIPSLFRTTDAGESWEMIGGNLEENPDGTGNGPAMTWCEIAYQGNEVMYLLGTTAGVFVTTTLDGSSTLWQPQAEDLIGRSMVEQIAYREVDGKIVVATHGSGLFETQLTLGVGNDAGRESSGASGSIGQIRPQPMVDHGMIDYEVDPSAAGEDLQISIYDLRGNVVARITAGRAEAGGHRMPINLDGQPSGIYVVRLRIGKDVMTRRLVKQ